MSRCNLRVQNVPLLDKDGACVLRPWRQKHFFFLKVLVLPCHFECCSVPCDYSVTPEGICVLLPDKGPSMAQNGPNSAISALPFTPHLRFHWNHTWTSNTVHVLASLPSPKPDSLPFAPARPPYLSFAHTLLFPPSCLMRYFFHPARANLTEWRSLCREKVSGAVNWEETTKIQVPNLKDSPLNPEGVQGSVWTLGDSRAATSERHQKHVTLIIMSVALLEERRWWQESLRHTEAKGCRRRSLDLPDYGKARTVDVLFVSFSRNQRENSRATSGHGFLTVI